MNLFNLFRRDQVPTVLAEVMPPASSPPQVPRHLITWAAAQRKPRGERPYIMPALPPGVANEEVRLAHDAALQPIYEWAQFNAWGEGQGFMGYAWLAELMLRAEYRRPAEIIAKNMTRKWLEITATGNRDKSAKVERLGQLMDKFKVKPKITKMIEQDGGFGRSQLYVDTGDAGNPHELTTPLTLDRRKIGKGRLKGFKVIEPFWTYPDDYNSDNPLAEDFFIPRTWWVQSRRVHKTRLLTMVSREVPDILKPAYMFGGLSLTQLAKPYVDNWLRTRQSVSDLVHSFSTNGLKTDMDDLTTPGVSEILRARVEFYNQMRDNGGLFLIDKNKEDFFNVATPLTGLDKLQAQAQEHMAAVDGIPLVVFFGITPSGLNASSDGEIRAYYDWTLAQQEDKVSPIVSTILDHLQLYEWGEIDEDIGHKWVPLWQLDEAGKASVEKTKADTDAVLIDKGVIDPEDSRRRIAADDESSYHGINPNDLPPPPPIAPNLNEGEPNGDPAKSAHAMDAALQAAGTVFIAPGDMVLFLKRSDHGDMPGAWALPAGKIEDGESAEGAAVRKAIEEIGILPEGSRRLLTRSIFNGAVDFSTFIQPVDGQFIPTLNDEHTGYAWASVDEPPQPLHPGVKLALDLLVRPLRVD